MRIGQLRHRVTIQKDEGGTNDGGGNITLNWVDVATIWADVNPINGQETVIAERRGQQITHDVIVRYRADVNAKMRLLFKGRVLNIQYIINVNEENKELKIQCLEA